MGEPSSKAAGNGKKSNVWEYYEKIKDAPKARCTLCNKELSYRGGTTNLRTHLECKHSLLYTHKAKRLICRVVLSRPHYSVMPNRSSVLKQKLLLSQSELSI